MPDYLYLIMLCFVSPKIASTGGCALTELKSVDREVEVHRRLQKDHGLLIYMNSGLLMSRVDLR